MSFFQQIRNKLNSLHELIFLNDNPDYCYEKFSDKKQIKILSDNVFPKIKKNPTVVKDNMFYASPWMMKISDIDTTLLVKKPDIFLFSTFFDYNKQYEKIFFTYYQAFVSFIKKFPEYIPLYKDNLLLEKAVIQIIINSDMPSYIVQEIITHYLNARYNLDVDIHYKKNEQYYYSCLYSDSFIYDDIAFLSQLSGISQQTDKLLCSFLFRLTDVFHYNKHNIIQTIIQTNLIYNPNILIPFMQYFLSSQEDNKYDFLLIKKRIFSLLITDLMEKYAIQNLDSQTITQYFLTVDNELRKHDFFKNRENTDFSFIKTIFNKSETFYIPENNQIQAQLFFISLFKQYNTCLYRNTYQFLNQIYTDELTDIDFSVFLAFSTYTENHGIMCHIHERLNTKEEFLQLQKNYTNIHDFFYHFQKIFANRFFYSFEKLIENKCRHNPDNLLLFYNEIINTEIHNISFVYDHIIQNIDEQNQTTCFLFLSDMLMFYRRNPYNILHETLTDYCFQKIRDKLIENMIFLIKNLNYELSSTSLLSFTNQLTKADLDCLFAILKIDYLDQQYFNHESLLSYIRKDQLMVLIETPKIARQSQSRL